MRPEFWHDRWRRSKIGFHQTSVEANLVRHWPGLGLHPGDRVMVPLCGKSLDLLWLAALGHAVVGVELSDMALQALCLENGIPARRRLGGPFGRYDAPGLSLLQGDFFDLTHACLGNVSAVYDRAALISFDPELRAAYVAKLTELTVTGTETLLIALEYPEWQTAGPPFSVDAAEVERLYGRNHSIHELERRDILENDPRMRARGVTSLVDVCYRLKRL